MAMLIFHMDLYLSSDIVTNRLDCIEANIVIKTTENCSHYYRVASVMCHFYIGYFLLHLLLLSQFFSHSLSKYNIDQSALYSYN